MARVNMVIPLSRIVTMNKKVALGIVAILIIIVIIIVGVALMKSSSSPSTEDGENTVDPPPPEEDDDTSIPTPPPPPPLPTGDDDDNDTTTPSGPKVIPPGFKKARLRVEDTDLYITQSEYGDITLRPYLDDSSKQTWDFDGTYDEPGLLKSNRTAFNAKYDPAGKSYLAWMSSSGDPEKYNTYSVVMAPKTQEEAIWSTDGYYLYNEVYTDEIGSPYVLAVVGNRLKCVPPGSDALYIIVEQKSSKTVDDLPPIPLLFQNKQLLVDGTDLYITQDPDTGDVILETADFEDADARTWTFTGGAGNIGGTITVKSSKFRTSGASSKVALRWSTSGDKTNVSTYTLSMGDGKDKGDLWFSDGELLYNKGYFDLTGKLYHLAYDGKKLTCVGATDTKSATITAV